MRREVERNLFEAWWEKFFNGEAPFLGWENIWEDGGYSDPDIQTQWVVWTYLTTQIIDLQEEIEKLKQTSEARKSALDHWFKKCKAYKELEGGNRDQGYQPFPLEADPLPPPKKP